MHFYQMHTKLIMPKEYLRRCNSFANLIVILVQIRNLILKLKSILCHLFFKIKISSLSIIRNKECAKNITQRNSNEKVNLHLLFIVTL